jgi:hypothetical protein
VCARVGNQRSCGVVTARVRTDAVRSLHHQRRDLHQSTYPVPLGRSGLILLSYAIIKQTTTTSSEEHPWSNPSHHPSTSHHHALCSLLWILCLLFLPWLLLGRCLLLFHCLELILNSRQPIFQLNDLNMKHELN